MNADMYRALKAGQFPTGRYQLLEASQVEKTEELSGGWMKINSRRIMEIGASGILPVNGHGASRWEVTGFKISIRTPIT